MFLGNNLHLYREIITKNNNNRKKKLENKIKLKN